MQKEKLARAYGGVVGEPRTASEEPTLVSPVPSPSPAPASEPTGLTPKGIEGGLDLNEEQTAKLHALQASKRGRPKGVRTGEGKEREDRATFIVPKTITRKLKYIALVQTRLYKDVIAEALSLYIDGFEAEHGDIKLV